MKNMLKVNEKIQMIITGILIFIMGISLGQREYFFKELAELGWKSIAFTFMAILCSVIFVYVLTRVFMKRKEESES